MTRLVLAIVLALSFLGTAPAGAVAPLAAAPADACSMAGDAPGQPADHGKMDCCTHDCAMFAAVGLLPLDCFGVPMLGIASMPALLPSADELDSLSPAAVDPPPRLRLA